MVITIVKQIALALLSSLLTEKFVREMIVYLLKKAAKLTDNSVDDEVVKIVEKALLPPEEKA